MPLLTTTIKDNANKRAAVFFKKDGIVTDLFGQKAFWQITDPAWIKKINDVYATKGVLAAIDDPLWEDLVKERPEAVAKKICQLA